MLFFYYIILGYFILGGVINLLILSKKTKQKAKETWIKYWVYLGIINIVLLCLIFYPYYFTYIALLIIIVGFKEILTNAYSSQKWKVGIPCLIIYTFISYIFYEFSQLNTFLIFYTYFLVIIFDGFSQLGGQLWGKNKLIESISPNKTWEGLMTGIIMTIVASTLIKSLIIFTYWESIALGFSISLFALIGDLSASFVKRKMGIKDFGSFIPGHGGILDRFDSFIFSSIIVYVIN